MSSALPSANRLGRVARRRTDQRIQQRSAGLAACLRQVAHTRTNPASAPPRGRALIRGVANLLLHSPFGASPSCSPEQALPYATPMAFRRAHRQATDHCPAERARSAATPHVAHGQQWPSGRRRQLAERDLAAALLLLAGDRVPRQHDRHHAGPSRAILFVVEVVLGVIDAAAPFPVKIGLARP